MIRLFVCLFFIFPDKALCSLGYLGTISIDQAGLKLTEIQLPLPSEHTGNILDGGRTCVSEITFLPIIIRSLALRNIRQPNNSHFPVITYPSVHLSTIK